MEPNVLQISGTPTPYGRACSNCARAKAKCTAGNGHGAKCERCQRLNKECQPIQTVRKRKTANKLTGNKSERLEEKLDGLFKLLQSSSSSASIPDQNAPASSGPTPNPPLPKSLQAHMASPENCEDFGPRAIQRLNWNRPSMDGLRLDSPTNSPDAAYVTSGTRSTTYHCPDNSLISGLEPSPDEAEEYLGSFRSHMATFFPFITVPQSTTARALRSERPFLWLCIMSVASKFTVQQKALGKEIRLTVGREILVEGKNNIDLLLGILVFVAWGHYHIYDRPVMIQMFQLAMALVGNLGLNKPPLKEPTQMVFNLDARGCPVKPFSPSARTTEERRAVLGCFLLSSVLSCYFQRLDALRWTTYLDECMAVLAEKEDQPTDTLLIHLVKLQLIVEKVSQGPWHDDHDDATSSMKIPAIFYLRALKAQLQDFKAKVPSKIQGDDLLLLHLYSTEIKIHEVALSKAPVLVNDPGFPRLESLYACLHATKSWFDMFLSLSPASYVGFAIPIFTQSAQCIIALFRLLTLDDPVWDRGLVLQTANLSHILEKTVEKYSQVKVAAGLDPGVTEDKDIFSGTGRTIKSIKTWWDAKVTSDLNESMGINETLGEINMDFFDDVWLRDIYCQGEGHFDQNMQWSGGGTGV